MSYLDVNEILDSKEAFDVGADSVMAQFASVQDSAEEGDKVWQFTNKEKTEWLEGKLVYSEKERTDIIVDADGNSLGKFKKEVAMKVDPRAKTGYPDMKDLCHQRFYASSAVIHTVPDALLWQHTDSACAVRRYPTRLIRAHLCSRWRRF